MKLKPALQLKFVADFKQAQIHQAHGCKPQQFPRQNHQLGHDKSSLGRGFSNTKATKLNLRVRFPTNTPSLH
ncbi:MAG: hypothetical protein V7K68_22180 [Nostoc sp.]